MGITKKFSLSAGLILLFFLVSGPSLSPARAAGLWDNQEGMNGNSAIGKAFGSSDQPQDIRAVAAGYISVFLSFLGVIFVGLLLYAGFMWMTAAGDAAKVDKAKSLITASIIGIIIILSAFAISQFVLRAIYGATQS